MPTAAPRRARRLLALVAAVLAAAAAIAACGSSAGSGGGIDPAALVPASAPVYLEATLHADDQEAADARAALAKILRTSDPAGKLSDLLDQGGSRHGIRFDQDVAPWLGDQIGVGVLSFGRSRPDAVVVAASTDDAKAEQAIAKIQSGGAARTYRGVDYRFDAADGTAAGMVGHAVVAGSEAGFKGAVDASKGASLADADALKKARDSVSQERSGFAYLDVEGTLRQAIAGAGDRAGVVGPLLGTVTTVLPKTVAAALDFEPDLVRVDSAALGQPASTRPTSDGADALAALPAGAWLGAGAGDVGQTITRLLDGLTSGGGLAGVGIQSVLAQLQQTTGLDLRRDVLAWMGDAGVFLAGTDRGALVVHSKDPAATRAFVRKLRPLVTRGGGATAGALDAPGVDEGFVLRHDNGGGRSGEVLVAAGGDKFVVATSRRALREALGGGATLGDAAAFTGAAGKLGGGMRPSLFVDIERATRLAAAAKGSDEHFAHVRPYLDAFGVVVAGTKPDGDVTRGRAIATLK